MLGASLRQHSCVTRVKIRRRIGTFRKTRNRWQHCSCANTPNKESIQWNLCRFLFGSTVCLSKLFYSINSVKLFSWFMNPSQIGFSNKPATLLKTYNGFRKYWQCYAIHLLLDLYWQLKTNTYILETSICLEDLEKHFKYHCLKKKLAETLFGENSRRIFSVLWLLSIKSTCQSLQ